MIKALIKIANQLDYKGYYFLANKLDLIITTAAETFTSEDLKKQIEEQRVTKKLREEIAEFKRSNKGLRDQSKGKDVAPKPAEPTKKDIIDVEGLKRKFNKVSPEPSKNTYTAEDLRKMRSEKSKKNEPVPETQTKTPSKKTLRPEDLHKMKYDQNESKQKKRPAPQMQKDMGDEFTIEVYDKVGKKAVETALKQVIGRKRYSKNMYWAARPGVHRSSRFMVQLTKEEADKVKKLAEVLVETMEVPDEWSTSDVSFDMNTGW